MYFWLTLVSTVLHLISGLDLPVSILWHLFVRGHVLVVSRNLWKYGTYLCLAKETALWTVNSDGYKNQGRWNSWIHKNIKKREAKKYTYYYIIYISTDYLKMSVINGTNSYLTYDLKLWRRLTSIISRVANLLKSLTFEGPIFYVIRALMRTEMVPETSVIFYQLTCWWSEKILFVLCNTCIKCMYIALIILSK